MASDLQQQLEDEQIIFRFNPPSAPHFSGTWEREIRSVKDALLVVLGSYSIPEPLLHAVLVYIEGILNSKPLGYITSNVANFNPVNPNMLLMGRRDASSNVHQY